MNYTLGMRLATVAGLWVATLAATAAEQPATTELEGSWHVQSMETAGEKSAEKDVREYVLVFEGNRFSLSYGDEPYKGTYTVDRTKNPKWIDSTAIDKQGNKQTAKGIYKIDGDILTIAWADPGDDRPTMFATTSDNGHRLLMATRKPVASAARKAANKVSSTLSRAWENAKDFTYEKRQDFSEAMNKDMSEYDARMAEWKEKAKEATGDAKVAADRMLANLSAKRDAAMVEMKKTGAATSEAWEDVKRGAGAAMSELNKSFNDAYAHFNNASEAPNATPTNESFSASAVTDGRNIQGNWIIVRQDPAGKEKKYTDVKGTEVVIDARTITVKDETHDINWVMAYRLDPAATPKQIKMTLTLDNKKTQQATGIYQIDGSEMLTICYGLAPDVVPSEFKAERGKINMFTLRRRQGTAAPRPE